ncbi:MAG: hypothetical protein KGR26_09450, partial [Cyanobacteria bacterium REEB65]|nr:hypothetical protein [Cyanobacteria bacterium REEB65]
MARERFGIRLIAAFKEGANLAVLGAVAIAAIADAAITHYGLRPLLWGVGILECGWLCLAPLSPTYRGLLIQRRLAAERCAKEEESRRMLDSLPPELAKRYQSVASQ